MERQLTFDDEYRKNRSVLEMQRDALRLADKFLNQKRLKIYLEVGYQRDCIFYALQAKDDLALTVLNVVTFLENFEPIVFDHVEDPLKSQAITELSAAHLAYHGKRDLAMITLGYGDLVDGDELEAVE